MGRLRNALINGATVTPAGTVIGDATLIRTKSPAVITAAGDGTAGIKLPLAVKGKMYIVKNTAAASTLLVWPSSGDQINAITVSTNIVLAAATAAVFVATDTTHWYTVSLLPS